MKRETRGAAPGPSERRRGRRGARGLVLPLLATAVAVTVTGCGPRSGDGAPAGRAEEGGDDYVRVVNVEVRTLRLRPFTERIRVTGTVEANRDVRLAAEETGTIESIPGREGAPIRAGEAIARIDDALLRAELEQAEAQAEVARETWERNRQLYEEDRAISELRFVETRARSREADASRRALVERLARTVVRAPFDGVLETLDVEVGSMVSPGTSVARLVQLDPVKVTGGVPERYAPDVREGGEAVVRFDVLGDRTFRGKLTNVGSVIHPQSRTFRVELVLPNPERAVKPEMVADITLVRRRLEEALVVPQEALVREEEGFVAFVVEEDGEGRAVARARSLELGPAQGNVAVVEQGLAAGDRLVVVGQSQVADGDRVAVVDGRPAGDGDGASDAAAGGRAEDAGR